MLPMSMYSSNPSSNKQWYANLQEYAVSSIRKTFINIMTEIAFFIFV